MRKGGQGQPPQKPPLRMTRSFVKPAGRRQLRGVETRASGHDGGMTTSSGSGDQLLTLRELIRDAIEIARSAAATAGGEIPPDVFERARASLAATLGDLDTAASKRP